MQNPQKLSRTRTFLRFEAQYETQCESPDVQSLICLFSIGPILHRLHQVLEDKDNGHFFGGEKYLLALHREM